MLKKIKSNYNIYKAAKRSPDPLRNSITETLAIIIDNDVVEIMYCQPKLAEILNSNPKFIKVNEGEKPQIGWKFINNKFIDPQNFMSTYPHKEKNENF